MLDQGYIKIYRSMLTWEWYDDINTKVLFLHLLLTANWEPKQWRGMVIERGQRVCSLPSLRDETGLSMQALRTSLRKLRATDEITDEHTSQYRIITVKNYCQYQIPTGQSTDEQQASNRRATGQQQQLKKDKKDKKDNIARFTPPTTEQVSEYCLERRNGIDAQHFIDHYTSNGWMVGKNHMKDWKAAIRTWERRNGDSSAGQYPSQNKQEVKHHYGLGTGN